MTIHVTCSWCHRAIRLIPGTATYCMGCGHRADVPRLMCDCPSCRRLAAAPEPPPLERVAWWEQPDENENGE